jgi:hypothetical protein
MAASGDASVIMPHRAMPHKVGDMQPKTHRPYTPVPPLFLR